jgi:Flp pilus assembly pilin Flp
MLLNFLIQIRSMVLSIITPRSITASRRARGVTMIEYALMAAMAVAIIAAVSQILTGDLTGFYNTIQSHL